MGEDAPKLCCKKPNFSFSQTSSKKFVWKSLKQIIAIEKTLPWPQDAITYSSFNAPPSFRPPKKYSDISGLIAPYTDPQTKLRYHNGEEFAIIKALPSDISSGYLALRGESSIVG